MFKNVGIYVRQKSNHGVDLNAMDSMISFLAKQNINLSRQTNPLTTKMISLSLSIMKT